jgi:G3E family GTPase
LPLSIITGFLGAGKTTLLNQMLRDPELADTVVIINEFGEIGLDHLLVERAEGDMLVLSSGCLCCSIRGDLIATLEDLLRRRDNGRMPAFGRVLIETTGLADPAPVLHTIMYHPYLMLRFALDGVITLVDAINGAATLDAHVEAVKQVAVADRLVLSKSDLADAQPQREALGMLLARLRQLNPAAPILDAVKGEATAASLLDAGLYDSSRKIADVGRWLRAEAYDDPAHDHDHDHGHGQHRHDVNRHDAHIRAYCLRSEALIALPAFDMFLTLLRGQHGPRLLRVKGIVGLADDPSRPIVIHGVQHVFHPPVRLDAWPDADHSTRIVFILRDLPESFVTSLWGAFTGAPEGPDAAALADNPLAPRRGGLLG